ncbi:A kinase (PRKA) anchor protein 1b [Simochromis diagramma]|uniref:A kinase (PRKA) anchor protein 1b n=1 Tax=Simochromis diagramma TaxID=43689 RepID=UPI001A7E6D7B|nr:A kinase (PRKA) anchor protein 1b [Simochromis diagramma]
MPLRFRSVVPYTLPGVLALIGWWWYISRKRERLINHDRTEGTPTTTDLKTSSADGSNGLVEKDTVSPTNDTDSPIHRPPNASNQRTQHENISQIHFQHTEASPSLAQSSEKFSCNSERMKQGVHRPPQSALPSLDKDDSLQVSSKDRKDPERSLSLALGTELNLVKDPVSDLERATFSYQSTKVTSSFPTTSLLSGAERPDPEGEVAKNHSTNNTQDEMIGWDEHASNVERVDPSEADSLDTPPPVPDFHQHILSSTPTDPVLASTSLSIVQNTTAVTPEDILVHGSPGEEHDLEDLAARLITKVISAATQEVLSVTSCQVVDKSLPNCSSGGLYPELEPIIATQKHHHLSTSPSQVGCDCREATEKEAQAVPNGCSSSPVWKSVDVSHINHQKNAVHSSHWSTQLPQEAQTSPVLNIKLKGDEAAPLAEDSACSTCHSEDGISSEDLQSSLFDNQSDVIQLTDLSAGEAAQGQVQAESLTEGLVLSATEEDSLDAACEIKGLNAVGVRNGAHGTCEVETDQSGGSDVNSMDSVDSGCTMGALESKGNHAASSTGLIIWEIEVPKHLVGRLIGKQGRYVSFLKQNSGAKIYISTLPYTQEFQICHIEGTQQQVDKALSLIGKKFKDLDLNNLYAAPPPPLTLPSLPMTSWLLLPSGVTVEVIVVNIVSAGHVFVQQHTHPTYHALRSLDQQMFLCYSQPGTPALPSPAEIGVICAAPAVEGAWWRAQVITFYKESNEVEIRYVDYGGYDRVKIDSLRQIRSDFVTLPFQGAEVLLDNIAPLPGEDRFSAEATSELEEMTRGVPLLAQVSSYDNNTGLPLVHLWNMVGEEVISVNRTLAERGLGVWVDGF